MINVTTYTSQSTPRTASTAYGASVSINGAPGQAGAATGAAAVADTTVISTLASRLSRAAGVTGTSNQGLDRQALADKISQNNLATFYPLDAQHKAAAAAQTPEPNDAASAQSAKAATAFVDKKGPNPFAGLSREQLSTIAQDESGTFTVNEKRAALTQAYDEELAWRQKVVAEAMREYNETGKMTKFFSSVLGHFNALPEAEQVLYPADYASGLQEKIDLDFNYFNHAAHDGPPTPGSLASLTGRQLGKDGMDWLALLELPKRS
ncbi:hypothetical protein [Janthinobacterium aquaticum]|uniref:hypothetical protein n=1 Tax=Janthinobacterium sp. FT58W TaxID=2654254 RepID=UPI001264B469|nr:hypothetical protein [Janthinobacterium sp. FT58W]KAB8044590.1 hypothetical protein GCM43_05175 [Janthinobacterium sp. FT58W]